MIVVISIDKFLYLLRLAVEQVEWVHSLQTFNALEPVQDFAFFVDKVFEIKVYHVYTRFDWLTDKSIFAIFCEVIRFDDIITQSHLYKNCFEFISYIELLVASLGELVVDSLIVITFIRDVWNL